MYFVVSDPHGCIDELKEILTYWDRKKDTLILMGDLIDRGPNSLACLNLALELNNEGNAIVLKGNHEELFLEWLELEGRDKSLEGFYYLETFNETVNSFFPNENVLLKYTKTRISEEIKRNHKELIGFMKMRPIYYETEKLIFAHAGCNGKRNWKDTAERDCTTIRNEFIYSENNTGKKIFFGHTTTENIRGVKGSNEIWVSPCKTKVGIDGSCVFGGQLNAVLLDKEGSIINSYKVLKK
ncbi:metallophosphoesterase [Bacillus mexicanus]|uniref:metallophosphoesterase n=1 Tax=Bacillus mexicanus TaxID=2834415 RepID=UPI003D1F5860